MPVVAVVIQSETGLADVYVRPKRSDAWQPLREGVSPAEALAQTSTTSGHPESVSTLEKERSLESIERTMGSPERG